MASRMRSVLDLPWGGGVRGAHQRQRLGLGSAIPGAAVSAVVHATASPRLQPSSIGLQSRRPDTKRFLAAACLRRPLLTAVHLETLRSRVQGSEFGSGIVTRPSLSTSRPSGV